MVLARDELGTYLREVREDRGITMRELSAASKVSLPYISEIERGKKEISSEVLNNWAYALNLNVAIVYLETAKRLNRTLKQGKRP